MYIGGVYYTEIKKEPLNYKDTIYEVLKGAAEDAGIEIKDIEGLVLTPHTLGGNPPSFMHAHHIGYYLGKDLKVEVMVENGGSTATLALRYAMMEVKMGRVKVCAVVGMDSTFIGQFDGMEFPHFIFIAVIGQTNLYGPYDSVYGIGAPIPYYAQAGQRYLIEKGISREDLSWVAVRMRERSSKNPKALIKKLISPDDVINSRVVCPPLHLYDCSVFASGAGAVIIMKNKPRNKKRPIRIRGYGEYHTPTSFMPHTGPAYYSYALRKATDEAFQNAKIKKDDIDVIEIYGVFSTTELTILEDMGICEEGKAIYIFKDGGFSKDDKIYVDPSGGRIGVGHPAGATPIIELCEVVYQLRGEGGERQKTGRCDIGVIQAEHGMLNGAQVFVLEGI